jgi:hypothetical protein
MSTLRQIEANRRNAQKSTGPTSVTGKATSSMNALKTGIHAKSLVLPTENLADLQQLIDEFYQHHHPASPEARLLLDDLIRCEWTLRRLGIAETQLFEYAHQEAFTVENDFPLGQSCMENPKPFGQLQWRIDSTRRALYRALHALQQLETAPAPSLPIEPDPPALQPPTLPPSPKAPLPQIGFVPPPPIPAPVSPQTDMDFRRTLPGIRCQSGLSPVSLHPLPSRTLPALPQQK